MPPNVQFPEIVDYDEEEKVQHRDTELKVYNSTKAEGANDNNRGRRKRSSRSVSFHELVVGGEQVEQGPSSIDKVISRVLVPRGNCEAKGDDSGSRRLVDQNDADVAVVHRSDEEDQRRCNQPAAESVAIDIGGQKQEDPQGNKVDSGLLKGKTAADDDGQRETAITRRNQGAEAEAADDGQEQQHDNARMRKYIRQLSLQVQSPDEHDVDARRLNNAVSDAGVYAYGVVAVEVYVLHTEDDHHDRDCAGNEDDDNTDRAVGRLVRPKGGWWRNPTLPETDALRRLEDGEHPRYVLPGPVMPGVDVAGELWAESFRPPPPPRHHGHVSVADAAPAGKENEKGRGDSDGLQNVGAKTANSAGHGGVLHSAAGHGGVLHSAKSPFKAIRRHSFSVGNPLNYHHQPHPAAHEVDRRQGQSSTTEQHNRHQSHHQHQQYRTLVWRDLYSLLLDPDTAKGPRLAALLQAGFGRAAAVPFDVRGHRGIVIYYTRGGIRSHRGTDGTNGKLSSQENEAYLHSAAELIGTTLAITTERRASLASKHREVASASAKFRRNLQASFRRSSGELSGGDGDGGDKYTEDAPVGRAESGESNEVEDGGVPKRNGPLSPCTTTKAWKTVTRRIKTWGRKCLGGNLQIPPPMPPRQATWTLLGCFVGLLVLSTMNEYAKKFSDDEYYLLIGPFGALMTLQYGLTAAPASQPRNAILGQAIAGAVSLSFTYIPDSMLAPWLRRAVGPSFAIATMVKLGIPHPPAGAHSVLYASGLYGWKFYLLVVLGSIISVAPATIINNMSDKRQYPTYWGYVPSFLTNRLMEIMRQKKDGKTKEAESPSG